MANGWVEEQYVNPSFYFNYYGFEWVKPLGLYGMYLLFGIMVVAALHVMLGYYYRAAIVVFFLAFTYVELIDKTNYLNHYYFVSVVSFMLIFLPAHRSFSLDVAHKPSLNLDLVPVWCINVIKLQLGLVYCYAGFAKLNSDWLFEAMPLKIWLTSNAHLPVIGKILAMDWAPYMFSWTGAIYDLFIVFFLIKSSTRIYAYAAVVAFHLMTAWLFQIGMFPYIMILSTLIFFSESFHEKLLLRLKAIWSKTCDLSGWKYRKSHVSNSHHYAPNHRKMTFFAMLFTLHFCIQLFIPLRHYLYPGDLFWTEEGYRFSWRVMLMEKAGDATFHISDPDTGRSWQIANWKYLTPVQEKMMSTQPDMILQFAHFLEKKLKKEGITSPEITVESYVTLNGRKSELMIDPTVDLTKKVESFYPKDWILTHSAHKTLARKN